MVEPDKLQDYVNLLTKHQSNLRAFIVSLMPGSPDVDDVMQETNAVLWLKRERFKADTNFLAWAFTIARYEVMRQRDRTKRLNHALFSEKLLDHLADMGTPKAFEPRMAALENCLKKLSDKQRKIVSERYTSGTSLELHAQKNGLSAGGLRMALMRIRESLKDCIDKTLTAESA